MADQTMAQRATVTETSPNTHHPVKFLAAAAMGAALLVMSGVTLMGTVICLLVATPLFLLFSPILVPGGIVVFLVATGFLFAGGFGIASLTALLWIYSYIAGKHPPGSDQLDDARARLANRARSVKERLNENGQYLQNKGQEVTQGA